MTFGDLDLGEAAIRDVVLPLIADHFEVKAADVHSTSRREPLPLARYTLWALTLAWTDLSISQIAATFAAHRSTVSVGISQVLKDLDTPNATAPLMHHLATATHPTQPRG